MLWSPLVSTRQSRVSLTQLAEVFKDGVRSLRVVVDFPEQRTQHLHLLREIFLVGVAQSELENGKGEGWRCIDMDLLLRRHYGVGLRAFGRGCGVGGLRLFK